MYFLAKRYFVPEPIWFRVPHWTPVRYATWSEAADAYVKARLGNVRAVGVPGYPAADIDIEYVPDEEVEQANGQYAFLHRQVR